MNVVIQTGLIVFGLLNLAFAGFVYIHNRNNLRIFFYALISVFASLWSISTLLTGVEWLSFDQFSYALYGHYIFGYLAYLSFLWFAFLYPTRSKISFILAGILSLLSIAILYFIPFGTRFFIELREAGSIADKIIFNISGYLGFIVLLSTVFFLGLGILIRKLQSVGESERYKELDRNQIYFAILANFIAGIFGIVFNLIFPLFGNFSFFYINPIIVTIALTGIGLYNIAKYRIFNAKVILAEFFTAGIWIISVARVALSGTQEELIINGLLLLATIGFGIFLIRSVINEVRAREEIEHLAKKLEHANIRLKELDTQKTQFLSIASHDLRAPLTGIRNFISLLLDGTYGKLPPSAEEGARQIFERASAMAASVDTYLNVSRIEQGRMKYDFTDADLAKVIADTVGIFKSIAEKKGLTFTFVGGKLPLPIKGDVPKLQEVFNNLIDNSIKYTPHGSIHVSVDPRGSNARVTIQDTGVGMSQETIGRLFKLFSTGTDSRKVNTSSTGLGLYISKAHVEAHKGKVWAESDGEGKGSRFIVELPLKK